MRFLKDILPVFKKHSLEFVEKRHEIGNIMTFIFKSDNKITWIAGQHGIITVSDKKLEGGSWRGFSIASAVTEGYIMISTRIPDTPSEYKKLLLNLKPGDKVSMRGPFGPFYLDSTTRPAVLIAGGIGITPYRSILKDLTTKEGTSRKLLKLLYADDNSEFAYKNELDAIELKNDFIKISYISDRYSVPKEIENCVAQFGNDAVYYISGPVSMVKSIKKHLIHLGIKKKNIKNELYIGYK